MLAPVRVNGGADRAAAAAIDWHGSEKREGRIDCPPDPRACARLPGDFGKRFLVFVDTEEEFDWSQPLRRDNVAVTAIQGLPDAHRFFRAAGVSPIYMADYPVVDDDRAGEVMAELHADGSEIGTQLHPWVNPPFEEKVTPRNSFTGNLPVPLQRAKLVCLTQRIADRVGDRPTAYRAGRYGIGPETAALLEEEGYRMDASVRALFDYSGEGGPDFSRFGPEPFWAGARRNLLELPLTAAYVGWLRGLGPRLYPLGEHVPLWRSLLARSSMVERIALSPEDFPLGVALKAIDRLLGDGVRLFSLSYHSPSVVPGHTPYVRDKADLDAFYAWWDGVFERFAKHGIEPARATDVIAAADAAR